MNPAKPQIRATNDLLKVAFDKNVVSGWTTCSVYQIAHSPSRTPGNAVPILTLWRMITLKTINKAAKKQLKKLLGDGVRLRSTNCPVVYVCFAILR